VTHDWLESTPAGHGAYKMLKTGSSRVLRAKGYHLSIPNEV
jgi:hypothetical protein